MAPWKLNNSYDRPIARRIAEQNGVPREYFGQQKMASVVEFPPPNIPITDRLRQEYFNYLIENRIISKTETKVDSVSPTLLTQF